ncbi:hypothetical protein GCM10027074_37910 [Streptomyces deserti]
MPPTVGSMTTTVRVTWAAASARRVERQFLATPAKGGTPLAEVVGAMLGAHAQVLSAAEVSVGVRAAGVTRADVRAALWEDRSLVKTHGPRGTVHLLPSGELPLWSAALTARSRPARARSRPRSGSPRSRRSRSWRRSARPWRAGV